MIDRFGTPYTGELHLIERYQLAENSKELRVEIRIEDTNTFTTPWRAISKFVRDGEFQERYCAENNVDATGGQLTSGMPIANGPSAF